MTTQKAKWFNKKAPKVINTMKYKHNLRISDWYSPINLFVRKRTVKAKKAKQKKGYNLILKR